MTEYLAATAVVLSFSAAYAAYSSRKKGVRLSGRDWIGLGAGIAVWWLVWSLPVCVAWTVVQWAGERFLRAALFAACVGLWHYACVRLQVILRIARWMERVGEPKQDITLN